MTSLSAPVPPVPVDVPPGSVAWLRASVARFSNGADHVRRRALAVDSLASADAESLRDKAYSRTSRIVAGLDVVDVMAEIARPDKVASLFRHAGGDKHKGFAAWHLLFYALWHRRHVEGRRSEGDVFEALSGR